MLSQILDIHQPHPMGWWIGVIVIGMVALYATIKIEHVLVRLVAGLITLLIVAGAVWWFFFRH